MMPFETCLGRVVLAVDRARTATTVMHACHGVWTRRLNRALPNAPSPVRSDSRDVSKGTHPNSPLSCSQHTSSFATESMEPFAVLCMAKMVNIHPQP